MTSRRLVSLLGGLVAVSLAVSLDVAVSTGTAGPVAAAGRSSSHLAFDLPSKSSLRSSPRLVFAHYFPAMPVSFDNEPARSDWYARNLLDPKGLDGRNAASGGLLRDRPVPRAPRSARNWMLRDLKKEVRQAVKAGLDGFTLDILQVAGDPDRAVWRRTKLMLRAAQAVDPGFRIVLMPDLGGSLAEKSPQALAKNIATLGASPAAHRLADGRLVVAPLRAEAHAPAWWQAFIATMTSTYRMPVALFPVFIGSEQTYAASYAPISYGMGNWGARNPTWNDADATYRTSPVGRALSVQALGMRWMQPVSLQDERPNQGVFDEAENTTNLRNTWEIARNSGADWVQIPTWNDYSENAHIAPSAKNGWSFLDINAYYLTWYKTGRRPKVVRDTVYLTHRTQTWQAKPSYPQTKLMALRGGSPARDTVEALTMLRRPGKVVVTVGGRSTSCRVSAGPDTCTVPLAAGTVRARVIRNGAVVARVQSPYRVTRRPFVQDLQYVGVSSRR